MVSKRQSVARKRFREANPELFPNPEPNNETKKKKKNKFKRVKNGKNGTQKLEKRTNSLRKHPLRIPGMRPGDCCFICKAQDHVAKNCPTKAEWEKHKICLLCRRRGHSLKNCPNNSKTEDKKFCYNCGEAGHSLSMCPQPLQDGGTKFANCFICKGQGHLSKHCPNNKHGIYPKGGSCKICNGITHLAKDCPNKWNGNNAGSTKIENPPTSSDFQQRGKVTIFRSGDDLEDDFMIGDSNPAQKSSNEKPVSHSRGDPISIGRANRKEVLVKPKKKQGPKVVNFPG